MYYHVQVEVEDNAVNSKRIMASEIDMSNLDLLKNYIVRPFLRQERFMVDGYLINPQKVKRFVIKKTEKSAKVLAEIENGTVSEHALIVLYPEDILSYDKYATDITKEVFAEVQLQITNTNNISFSTEISNRVFIVHGHDEIIKEKTARLVSQIGLKPIILHEQANGGKTIIEKFESNAKDVGFAIILLTDDDKGNSKVGALTQLNDRARQNVIFEMGYFYGKIGRGRVVALLSEGVEKPGDIDGMVYIPLDKAGVWRYDIVKELISVGYNVSCDDVV